jgi:hypothetical protein
MSGKLRLPDVTLCAADCLHPNLAARALEKCMAAVEFGDAVLLSDKPVAGSFRWKEIPPLRSSQAYSRFCLKDMLAHVETRFVLVAQWDGYVVDPSAWTPAFTEFDYVGAPVGSEGLVGNGGFSLRSRKLLSALQLAPEIDGYPEDVAICRLLRPQLEQRFGIRFAPTALAGRFSYDDTIPRHPTFGFHGMLNLRRQEPESELLPIAASLTPGERASWQYIFLALEYVRAGRANVAVDLYGLARRDMATERIKSLASKGPLKHEAVSLGVDELERMLNARGARVRGDLR